MESFKNALCIYFILGWFAFLPYLLVYALLEENKIIIGMSLLSIISDKSSLKTLLGEYNANRIFSIIIERCKRYFPIHVEYTHKDLSSENGNIYMYEPHDIFPLGIFGLHNSLSMHSRKTAKVLASSAILKFPFVRQIWYCCGIDSIDKQTCTHYAKNKYDMVMTPGGVREVYHNFIKKRNEKNVYIPIQNRYGFVKLAMENNKNIVPIVSFGQKEVYLPRNIFPISFISKVFSALKFVPLFFVGKYKIPLGAPFRYKIHVIVGKPLNIDENDTLESYHKKVCKELVNLYDTHKRKYGYEDSEMIIIDTNN